MAGSDEVDGGRHDGRARGSVTDETSVLKTSSGETLGEGSAPGYRCESADEEVRERRHGVSAEGGPTAIGRHTRDRAARWCRSRKMQRNEEERSDGEGVGVEMEHATFIDGALDSRETSRSRGGQGLPIEIRTTHRF